MENLKKEAEKLMRKNNFSDEDIFRMELLLNEAYALGEEGQSQKRLDKLSNDSKAIGEAMAGGCYDYTDTLN